MPILLPKDMPAYKTLDGENIFVMSPDRADTQDIRPIEILLLNLMPTKIETETQISRLLSNTPLQVRLTLLKTATHVSKNTSEEHLEKFYQTFDQIKDKKYDGMIITGAPVEQMDFEEVEYWQELNEIFDYAEKNVTSTMYICWGAQAALYHHYGIKKHQLDKKLFGVFQHKKMVKFETLLNGIDDIFYVPQSRHTKLNDEDLMNNKDLVVLAKSDEAGATIIKSSDNKKLFLLGHLEYDKFTLDSEYKRDLSKGLPIEEPKNYYINGDVNVLWRSTANILFYNWLNYYVYQVTPYEFKDIAKKY
ncbi:MAG: homoserine O-succinyltransferase [Anaeroplasmataceae bacterium]